MSEIVQKIEGEFKKRVIEVGIANCAGLETKLMIAKFFCLLDEARKEFPQRQNYYVHSILTGGTFDHETYCRDFEKWILKWFGEP